MTTLNTALLAIERHIGRIPDGILSLIIVALAAALAWWLHAIVFDLVTRWVKDEGLFRRSLVSRTQRVSRLLFLLLGLSTAVSVAPVSESQAEAFQHVTLIGIILMIGWGVRTSLYIWTTLYLRRFKLDSEDNLLARKHATQSRILLRVANLMIVMVTIATALMTFDGVRQYGVSLLASAGAAGIIVGFALQPILKNLAAGIQLAITQPIRIDDALLVENEWGNVEEITATYVVVRLWDWRRLVIPLSYFLEKPFQNWTREGSALIGTVFLYTDFTVPVEALRTKLGEIARASTLWDGQVVNLQVTDFKERTMEIRMLVSARTAARTFDLRCEVREEMIAFLQSDYPQSLPRTRTEIHGDMARAAAPPFVEV